METLSFLQRVLPPAPAYFMQLLAYDEAGKTIEDYSKSIKAYSLEHLAKMLEAATAKGYDAYISMAGYPVSAKGHYAKFAQSHRTFYLDLDCGPNKPYANQIEAIQALSKFLTVTGLPAPMILSSGGGIHAHWPCTELLDTPRWLKIATLLRNVAEHSGFAIDARVTIDPVRLMRPTGTLNRKQRKAPRPVRVLYEKQENYANIPLMTFAGPLVAYAKQHRIGINQPQPAGPTQYDSDLSANMPGLEAYSASQIADEGCVAVKWFMFNGGDTIVPKGSQQRVRMSNSDWMAMGRLAKFSTEGEAWFHEHSAKYQGYSAREAQGVLNRSEKRGVTCASLVTDPASRRASCDRCKHCGKISTPLNLGTRKPPKLEDVPPEELQQPAAPQPRADEAIVCPPAMEKRGYSYDEKGVWRKVGTQKVFITNYMIEYMAKLSQNARAHYLVYWRAAHGRRVEFEVSGSDLAAHPQVVMEEVGRCDIGYGNKSENIVGYIRDWMNSISAQDAMPAVTQMGWQDDGSFVVGTDCYKDGRHSKARLVGPVATEALMYEPKGTLEGQLTAIRTLFPRQPDFIPAQILLLGGACPMPLKHERMNSPTISTYSLSSGHGKSLAQEAAQGFWGNPSLLEMKGKDASPTSINNRLAATGSLPLVLDELTGSEPQHIFNLINLIQGNKSIDRAHTDGTNRLARTWRSVAYISTNEPLRQKLQAVDSTTDGVSMRLIEFEYVNPTVKESLVRVDIEPLFQNFGHLGRYIAEKYTADLPRYEEMYRAMLDHYLRIPGETRDNGGERMWHRWFANVQLMAYLCIVEWKLFDWDYEAICRKLVEYLKQQRVDFRRHSPDELTRLNDVIWRLSRNAVRLEVSRPLRRGDRLMTKTGVLPNGDVSCRQEDDTGLTYIYTKAFHEEAGSYTKQIIDYAVKNGLAEPKVRRGVKLKAYLGMPDTQVTCYVFFQKAIDKLVNSQKDIDSAVVDTYEDESAEPHPHAPHLRTVK